MISGSLLMAYHVVYYDLTLLAFPIATAFATGSRMSRALAIALLVGLPLWFTATRNVTAVVLALFLALVWEAWRRPVGEAAPPTQARHTPDV
jgi:hypothetical protein